MCTRPIVKSVFCGCNVPGPLLAMLCPILFLSSFCLLFCNWPGAFAPGHHGADVSAHVPDLACCLYVVDCWRFVLIAGVLCASVGVAGCTRVCLARVHRSALPVSWRCLCRVCACVLRACPAWPRQRLVMGCACAGKMKVWVPSSRLLWSTICPRKRVHPLPATSCEVV